MSAPVSGPAVVGSSGRETRVVGTAGAEPDELARLLGAAGVSGVALERAELAGGAGVLALDLSTSVGEEERLLLAGLAGRGGPLALAGVGAGLDPDWPVRLAAARAVLDPHARLPVFAICLEAARAGGTGDGGVAALAQWCADPGTPEPGTRPVVVPAGRAVAAAAASANPPLDPAHGRAERIAGARAGLAQVRAATAADLRAGAAELARAADEAVVRLGGPGRADFADWLATALTGYVEQAERRLSTGLDRVRGAALLGLPPDGADPDGAVAGPGGGSGGAWAEDGVSAEPVPLRPGPRRPVAEDGVLLALGASAGLGLGRMLVAPLIAWAGLGAAGTVLTVLAGLAVAAGVVAVRRSAAEVAALRRGAAEAVAGTRGVLENAAAARIGAAEARLSRELWNRTRLVSVQPCIGPDRRRPDGGD